MNGTRPQEVELATIVAVLVRRRRAILRHLLIGSAFFLVLGWLWPASYVARTTLLPPDTGNRDELLGLLENAPWARFALPAAFSSSELFAEILASRSVGTGVLHHPLRLLDTTATLLQLWKATSEERALKRLREHTLIATSPQGVIEIAVEMRSPDLAAAVANAYVAELDRVNREKSVSAARNSRLYIEEQLEITSAKLAALADSVARFQSRYGALALDEQMRAMLARAGEIKGTIIAKEIEYEMMRRSMKPGNPALAQREAEIAALEKQYQQMQRGSVAPVHGTEEVLMPFAAMPEIARRLAELLRELKVQETVWQLLHQQYFQAKIQEARDTPTVQVLDPAVPPETHAKPKRLIMWLTGTAGILLLSVLWALAQEYFHSPGTNSDGSSSRPWHSSVATKAAQE